MCGIVGLYFKTSQLTDSLGKLFAPMLQCMGGRGMDSTGVAIYHDPAPAGAVKVTLQHPDPNYRWQELAEALGAAFGGKVTPRVNSTHALFAVRGDDKAVRRFLAQYPQVRIMSIGRSIEILKEVGSPDSVIERFGIDRMKGTHAIGHTRMATESAVTTAGSHPFSTGMDLCLVHNGSLSNYNRLRRELQRKGVEFYTENDSEVAAGYLTWRLSEGASLEEALHAALKDLDGFYTFTIGTAEGFAVLRDPIACKPAVLAETDQYVAMASEYRSLAHLPGIEDANLWEPEPATVYTWGKENRSVGKEIPAKTVEGERPLMIKS